VQRGVNHGAHTETCTKSTHHHCHVSLIMIGFELIHGMPCNLAYILCHLTLIVV
jgi:hypothetical protein